MPLGGGDDGRGSDGAGAGAVRVATVAAAIAEIRVQLGPRLIPTAELLVTRRLHSRLLIVCVF